MPKDSCGGDNTTPDGDYIVGKGRPPESGKFRKGDGRKRGRRPKGTRNLATDFREELEGLVPVTVRGVTKMVTAQQAVLMRLIDNAMKGQHTAIAAVLDHEQRLVAPVKRREEEEQRKRAEQKFDVSCLSRDELRALQFLHYKIQGLPNDSQVAGVMAIYKDGRRSADNTRHSGESAGPPSSEAGGEPSGGPGPHPDGT